MRGLRPFIIRRTRRRESERYETGHRIYGRGVNERSAGARGCCGQEWPREPRAVFSGDKLVRPDDRYREWIYISSGLGMNYSPAMGSHEMFTNVFVPQWAYHAFVASGKWPDGTWFVVEDREQQTKGSINKTGHFEVDLMGLGVEVKDSKRFRRRGPISISGRMRRRRPYIRSRIVLPAMNRMRRWSIVLCSFIRR